MNQNAELLKRYVNDDDQAAFAALVNQHLRLVYSAAYLRTGKSRELAEEVSQRVFCDLAWKSPALQRHPCLEGWLFTATRFKAVDASRDRLRRQQNEIALASLPELEHDEQPIPWETLGPLLEAILDKLKEADRTAVVLRFFENRTYAQIGDRLGIGENAARMKVERCIDRMNTHARNLGLRSSRDALTSFLSANASLVPASTLAGSITRAALAKGKASYVAATLLTMSKLKILLLSGAAASVLAVGVIARSEYKKAQARPDSLTALAKATATPQPNQEQVRKILNDLSAEIATLEQKLPARPADEKVSAEAAREAYNKKYAINTASPYSYEGISTPQAAAMTFAWASVEGDVETLATMLYFDGNGRAKAEAILARLPESIRRQYSTPEKLFALFLAAEAKDYPPPPADLIRKATVVLLNGERAGFAGPDGKIVEGNQLIKTDNGWKYVFPELGVEPFARAKLSPKS